MTGRHANPAESICGRHRGCPSSPNNPAVQSARADKPVDRSPRSRCSEPDAMVADDPAVSPRLIIWTGGELARHAGGRSKKPASPSYDHASAPMRTCARTRRFLLNRHSTGADAAPGAGCRPVCDVATGIRIEPVESLDKLPSDIEFSAENCRSARFGRCPLPTLTVPCSDAATHRQPPPSPVGDVVSRHFGNRQSRSADPLSGSCPTTRPQEVAFRADRVGPDNQ